MKVIGPTEPAKRPRVKPGQAIFAAVLIVIAIVAIAGSGGDGSLVAGISKAESDKIAAGIRTRGYHCPELWDMSRQEVHHDGSKDYRIACGAQGPYYLLTVQTDGLQLLRPVSRR